MQFEPYPGCYMDFQDIEAVHAPQTKKEVPA